MEAFKQSQGSEQMFGDQYIMEGKGVKDANASRASTYLHHSIISKCSSYLDVDLVLFL
jgi:hypothetical protein